MRRSRTRRCRTRLPVQDESSDSEAAAGGLAGTGGEPAEVPVAAKVDPAVVLPQPERPRVTNVSYSSSGNDVDSDNTPAGAQRRPPQQPEAPGGRHLARGRRRGPQQRQQRLAATNRARVRQRPQVQELLGTSSCRASGATTTSST